MPKMTSFNTLNRTSAQEYCVNSAVGSKASQLVRRASQFMYLVLLAISVSNTSHAAGSDGRFFGKEAKGKWLIGVKAAKIDNNLEDLEDADGLGIILGYEFDKPIGNDGTSTVELEYVQADDTSLFGVGTYDADILNLFFTYRSAGTLYYKAKGGLTYTDIRIDSPGLVNSFEDVSFAFGIGLGYHIGDIGVVELEYSLDTGNTDLGMIGVNALLEF